MNRTSDTNERHLSAFETACRKLGLRLTHQRLEIYRELLDAVDHPSAEVLHQRLRKKIPTLSLDTVYRTLATFATYGLSHRVETVQSQGRFEVRQNEHHHLICSRCHRIMDFYWSGFEMLPLPEAIAPWGRVESRSVVIYGVCHVCLSRKDQG
ncbi:Fe2+/Zn2+ uptake regulation protein [Desulfuromonas soudanensis]|uniref:Fe2+/Zn2+ uptake regulation protein n=1 Tax=Desulfuromonas soudanensis TaxID=1603606 RepID=A0A0M4CZA7_9BACT|nr:Fur family transcriptional regulator [Desulfuromonas soudanensis]ALC15815.1 Fe2+/Zn2+ uptake regulation protein [Desulfuromonas soudanensis]